MRRTTIAPDVKRCIDIAWESTLDDTEVNVRAADRQLRAILAVVTAVGRDGKPFADDEGPACACGPCRAYARLARLSRARRGARAGGRRTT